MFWHHGMKIRNFCVFMIFILQFLKQRSKLKKYMKQEDLMNLYHLQ